MRLLSTLFFLLFSTILSSATVMPEVDSVANVVGVVQQEVPEAIKVDGAIFPIGGCVIQVFFEKNGRLDSLYTISNSRSGRFSFKNLPAQRVIFKLQCLGYENQSGMYELAAGTNFFFFTMKEKHEQITSAVITSEIPLLTQLKDTTIYNTKAIRSLPGDGLKDLLSQLPGFVVGNSGMTVDGVKVSRTYVNGLLIFGDDAMNAVNALKADDVTKVKVYDEQSAIDKRRGKKHSKKERVLNVITSKQFMSMSQASVGAAGGIDDTGQGRYGAIAAAEFDSEMMNMSASAYIDNYRKDENSIYRTNNTGFFLAPEGKLSDYQENIYANVFWARHWKNRSFGNGIHANYILDRVYNKSANQALTEYFQSENNPEMSIVDSTSSNFRKTQHTFIFVANLMDTPLKSLKIGAAGKLSNANSGGTNIRYSDAPTFGANQTHETSIDKNRDYSLSVGMDWTNNDVVKWRPLAAAGFSYSNATTVSWCVDTLSTSFLKRQLSGDGIGKGYNFLLTGGVQGSILNNSLHTLDIEISSKFQYDYSHNKKMMLDEWDVPSPVMDIANSYDFTKDEMLIKTIVGLNYSNSKQVNARGEISLNGMIVGNNEAIPKDFKTERHFIYPEYDFNISLPKWNFQSSLNTVTPSVEQLRNRISDSNPLMLVGGNPNLKQAYNLSFNGRFNSKSKIHSKGRSSNFEITASGNCLFNPIVNQSRYFFEDTPLTEWDGYLARHGATLLTYQNTKIPSWNLGYMIRYATRVFRNRVGLKMDISGGYGRSPQLAGKEIVTISDLKQSISMQMDYSPNRLFRLTDRFTTSYFNSKGINASIHSDRFLFSNVLKIKWYILPRLRFTGSYVINAYEYISGYGKDNFSQYLNLGLVTALLKDASLEIGLQAVDLLNTGSRYNSSINALYMRQSWDTTYGQYFLVSIRYTFRKMR